MDGNRKNRKILVLRFYYEPVVTTWRIAGTGFSRTVLELEDKIVALASKKSGVSLKYHWPWRRHVGL